MKKKKIVVFGAAGFVGTYLIDELLKQNYEVLASDISEIGEMYYKENNIPYLSIDITNKDNFDKIPSVKYDVVIHLAAVQPANVSEKKFDPRDYISVNVIGTLNILEFCRNNNNSGKIIYASSHRNTQGLWTTNRSIKESDGRAQKYDGEYAMFSISESAAQDCVEYYRAQHSMKGILFRLPPVYGYGPHTEIFKEGKPMMTGFQTFIERAMAGEPLEIWGDTSVGRDVIYVKDVVAAFIKAIENDEVEGLFNITSGRYLTIREQAEITAKVFWNGDSKPVIVELPDKPHNMDSFFYDNTKAKKELDWTPKYNFEDLLIDYKKEMQNKKFEYLVKKRQMQLKEK